MKPGGDVTSDTLAAHGIATYELSESCIHARKEQPRASLDTPARGCAQHRAIFGAAERSDALIASWQERVAAVSVAGLPPVLCLPDDLGEDQPFTAGAFASRSCITEAAGGQRHGRCGDELGHGELGGGDRARPGLSCWSTMIRAAGRRAETFPGQPGPAAGLVAAGQRILLLRHGEITRSGQHRCDRAAGEGAASGCVLKLPWRPGGAGPDPAPAAAAGARRPGASILPWRCSSWPGCGGRGAGHIDARLVARILPMRQSLDSVMPTGAPGSRASACSSRARRA
ncbi:MAG: hypothetical protein U1E17_04520 [Geminicoccaceae bacterium]